MNSRARETAKRIFMFEFSSISNSKFAERFPGDRLATTLSRLSTFSKERARH